MVGKLEAMRTLLIAAALFSAIRICVAETPAEAVPSYRFGGGEKIKLIVPQTVGETIEQLISEDGFISLPTGKPLNIKGKTIPEAHELITAAIKSQSSAKEVSATLALLELPPRRVYIGGEVRLPQAILMPQGTQLTLAAALASAGGSTTEGDLSRVSLVQTLVNGQRQASLFDASRLGQVDASDLGPVLLAGAVITVPRGDVYVLAGEVAKPGTYGRKDLSLRPGEAVRASRVLLGGGGLKPGSNKNDIRLIRTDKDGSREVIAIDLKDALGAKTDESSRNDKKSAGKAATETESRGEDPLLKDGDIILVGANGGVTILGRVRLPGIYPLEGEKLRLTRLIALAGGFSEFAKTSQIIVIHATSPKTPLKVDMGAMSKDGNLDKDVELGDGDVVFVNERLL